MHNLNFDWDDLRFVLGVAEHGSIRGAANSLAVNRTTVLRRIKRFEHRLNCELFERAESGYVLTMEAERLLAAAKDVERTLADLERKIAGRELLLEGDIRITTTDSLMMSTVAPHLATFSTKHPHITVEVALTNQRLNLSRREADVAIRPLDGPPDQLAGKKLSDLEFALYASPTYLDHTCHLHFEQHRWLGVDEPLNTTPVANWLRDNAPTSNVSLKAGSFVVLRLAAEHGLGLALLPTRLGDQSANLVRYGDPIPEVKSQLWILTHSDLSEAARIRAFVEHFADAFKAS